MPELFACWVIVHAFVVVCLHFSKLTFSKYYLRITIQISNGVNQDRF